MTQTENAHRARAGAGILKAGERFENQHTNTDPKAQYQLCGDECCYRLSRALRAGRLKPGEWGFNFTRSILRNNKRRDWKPSEKQLIAMRRLVAELTEPDEDLIDGGDDGWAA